MRYCLQGLMYTWEKIKTLNGQGHLEKEKKYSWLSVTRTLSYTNLPLTRSEQFPPSGHFLYNFTFDNSKTR